MRHTSSVIAGALAIIALGAIATAFHGHVTARRLAAAHLEAQRVLSASEAELVSVASELDRAERTLASAPTPPPAPSPVGAAAGNEPQAAARQAAADEAAKAAAIKAAIAEMRRTQLANRLFTLEMHLRPRFSRLGLSDEKWEAFEMLAADPGEGADAEKFRAAMRALVGDAAFEELVRYDDHVNDPSRELAQELSAALMFSEDPLQPEQFAQAAALFAQHGIARPGQPHAEPGAHAPVSAALTSVLSPEQMAAWTRIATARELDAQLMARLQARR